MKLRIILSSMLIVIIATGVTFQQLAKRVYQDSPTSTTFPQVSTSTTTVPLATTTSAPSTSPSTPSTTTTTHVYNPVPVLNPPVVIGGSGHLRTTCPLTSPYATVVTTTTSTSSTTTSSSSTTTDPSASSTLAPTTTTTSASTRSCTILQVGDSLGYGRGNAMATRLSRNNWLKFYIDDRGSTGLSNLPYFNWINQIRDDLNRYHPNLLIVSFGGNDAQQLTGDGQIERFGTARWKFLYASRVHQVLALAAAKHCGVLWLGMPISEQYLYNQEQLVINQIYSHEVASSTDAAFIPLWNVLAKHGQFTWTARVNGYPETLRSQDGIHPSPWGYYVEATYVINQMKTIYHVNLELSSPAYITGF